MNKILNWLQGKKTIITSICIAANGGIMALHEYGIISWQLPDWVWAILAGALGISIKSALNKATPPEAK